MTSPMRPSRSFNFRGLTVDRGGGSWERSAMRLTEMSDRQLGMFDVATLNLFCALGLNGADDLDPDACHAKARDWTSHVAQYTQRSLPRFHCSPDKFEHSLPKFKMLCMVTALQRDLGMTYYVPFSEGEYNASDARNLFIHGILSGHGGTCVSMPVQYVAIGRGLGYPLFLVREGAFLRSLGGRWGAFQRRGDFARILSARRRPLPPLAETVSQKEIDGGFYLRNLTRREELAVFLHAAGRLLFRPPLVHGRDAGVPSGAQDHT